MANNVEDQDRNVALWDGKAVVVLNELYGDTVVFHGLAVGPPGMPYATALAKIDAAFLRICAADQNNWNYDDLYAELRAEGFELVDPAVWWEDFV